MILIFGIGTTLIYNEIQQLHQPRISMPFAYTAWNTHQANCILPPQHKLLFSCMSPTTNFFIFSRTIQTQSHIDSNNNANVLPSKPIPASGNCGLTMNGFSLLDITMHQITVFETSYNNVVPFLKNGIKDSFLNPKLITNTQLSGNYLYDLLVNLLFFSGFFITLFIMKGKPVFNLFLNLIIMYLIKNYFSIHILSNKLFIDSMTGTSLKNTTLTNPPAASKFYLKYDQYANTSDIWHLSELETLKTLSIFGTLALVFSIFLYLNFKIYVKNCKNQHVKGKRKSKDKKNNMVISLLLITLFKFVIMVFIISASYNKIKSDCHPQKTFKHDYFLSLEYFIDMYQHMDAKANNLHYLLACHVSDEA